MGRGRARGERKRAGPAVVTQLRRSGAPSNREFGRCTGSNHNNWLSKKLRFLDQERRQTSAVTSELRSTIFSEGSDFAIIPPLPPSGSELATAAWLPAQDFPTLPNDERQKG